MYIYISYLIFCCGVHKRAARERRQTSRDAAHSHKDPNLKYHIKPIALVSKHNVCNATPTAKTMS